MKSANPLRVCIFSKAMAAHRGGRFLWPFTLISKQLRDLGHEVVVITTGHPDGMTTTIRENGVEVHYLKGTRSEKTNKSYWAASARLFDTLHRGNRFDLVMGRGRSSWGFLDQSRYSGSVPLISHEGTYPSWLHPYKITPNKLTTTLKWAHALADATANRKHAACLMRSDLVIANSHALADAIDEAYWWNPPATRYIPYAAPANSQSASIGQPHSSDIEPFIPRDWLDQSEPFVAYVGRVTRKKGAMDLLRILHGCRNKKLRLLVCGSANKANRERMKRLAHELGITNRITMAGAVPHQELPSILAKASAFVFPSTHPESLPKSVMEAMASGVPVLGYRIPAMLDLVRHGVDGMLVPAGDLRGLSNGIDRLLDDETLQRFMGHNGKVRVETEFNPFNVALIWEDALQTYAGNKRRVAPTLGAMAGREVA